MTTSLERLKSHVQMLTVFGFPELTDKLLQRMEDELPALQAYAKAPFDWSAINGALVNDKEYKKGANH